MADEHMKQIEAVAEKIIRIARDTIVMNLRFLEYALSQLKWHARPGTGMITCNGEAIYYDPTLLVRKYKTDQNSIVRLYLHILLHCVFHHNYQYEKLQTMEWDFAADIAVENIIMELNLYHTASKDDEARRQKLANLEKRAGGLTAQKLYRLFRLEEPSIKEQELLHKLFYADEHILWTPKETIDITLEQWKKISQRVKADLKSFSKDKSGSESLQEGLNNATRERVDYTDFLRRFMVMGEDVHINDDEFDYIYYTYGLNTYGNMPLVEPLEYKDTNKIKEFVIAIDTSASCRGKIVQAFLKKTYEIMKGKENFFQKINVHIIQCDSDIQDDVKITNDQEFDAFIESGKLHGFGSTDFRPVFQYVDQMIREEEFENLKGVIYFTDGYGVYPERMPDYDVAFVFLNEDLRAPQVPPWAIKVVLEEEQIVGDKNEK